MVVRWIEQNYVSFIAITVVAWDIIQVAAVVQCVFVSAKQIYMLSQTCR